MSRYEVYFGSFKKGDTALLKGVFDSEDGGISLTDRLPMLRPSYMTLSPDKNTLFAILETAEIDGVYGGGVASVDVSGSKMRILSSQSIHAKGPSHLCLMKGDKDRLIVSVYGEGALAQFPVDASDLLGPTSSYIQHCGTGANPARQSQPHPHFVAVTPDGGYIALCDLGLDCIMMYPYSPETGLALEAKTIPAPAGCGPRHLVFSKDGSRMYVLTEMGCTVLVYAYHGDGTADLLQVISALPENYNGPEPTAAAIRMNADETELIVSNRGADSLAFFRILPDQMLALEGWTPTDLWPRDFNLSPDGGWLLCANQNADTISVYRYSADLSLPLDQRVVLHPELELKTDIMPCCILFGKKLD